MKNRKRVIAFLAILLASIIALAVIMGALFLISLNRQNQLAQQITALTTEVEGLNEKMASLSQSTLEKPGDSPTGEVVTASTEAEAETETETEGYKGMYDPDTFNYLALGNSITKHTVCDYWWGTWGMAATKAEKDYPHLVAGKLANYFGPVTMQILNISTWETQSYDRAQTLTLLDNYLDDTLNLVTIQLGEDCYDMTTFENDYIELIRYIQQRAPNAHVMVLGDVWNFPPRDELKMAACVTAGVPFVDMSEIRDNPAYQCGLGTVVYGDDGQQHTVEHAGAAKHPGDSGHKYMADKVYAALNYWEDTAGATAVSVEPTNDQGQTQDQNAAQPQDQNAAQPAN